MDYAQQLKDAIKQSIEQRHGEISDRGCYSGNAWLSTEDILNLVCDVIDANGYMFVD